MDNSAAGSNFPPRNHSSSSDPCFTFHIQSGPPETLWPWSLPQKPRTKDRLEGNLIIAESARGDPRPCGALMKFRVSPGGGTMSRWPFHRRKGQPHRRSVPRKDGHPHTVSCAGQAQAAHGPAWPSNQWDPPEVPQPSESFGPRPGQSATSNSILSISQALFNSVEHTHLGTPFCGNPTVKRGRHAWPLSSAPS